MAPVCVVNPPVSKKKKQHGGPRPGAGRKPLGDPLNPKTIRASDAQWDRWHRAAEASGKTLSEWLRKLADTAADDTLGPADE